MFLEKHIGIEMRLITFKNIGAFALAVSVGTCAHAASFCKTEPTAQSPLPERYSYEVAGVGRLYLYSAPSEDCLDKNLFVVPGDSLIAYAEYGKHGEWSYVMYTAKSENYVNGWVLTNRLKFTGASGPDMSTEAIARYEKAAAAAKAGKMGAP